MNNIENGRSWVNHSLNTNSLKIIEPRKNRGSVLGSDPHDTVFKPINSYIQGNI